MTSNIDAATAYNVAPVLYGSAASTGVIDPGSIFHSSRLSLHLPKEVISPLLVGGPTGQLLDCIELLFNREESVLPVTRHIQVRLGVVSHDIYALLSEPL